MDLSLYVLLAKKWPIFSDFLAALGKTKKLECFYKPDRNDLNPVLGTQCIDFIFKFADEFRCRDPKDWNNSKS